MRRPLIWLLLIAISLALHGLVSSRVGQEIKQTQAATEALNAIAESCRLVRTALAVPGGPG